MAQQIINGIADRRAQHQSRISIYAVFFFLFYFRSYSGRSFETWDERAIQAMFAVIEGNIQKEGRELVYLGKNSAVLLSECIRIHENVVYTHISNQPYDFFVCSSVCMHDCHR